MDNKWTISKRIQLINNLVENSVEKVENPWKIYNPTL